MELIHLVLSIDFDYMWRRVNSSDSNSSCKEQKGILRSNCLDSLDRTNFAQFVYGMVSLGLQLHTLGITESKELDCQNPLAFDLMNLYQAMGDALSQQYAGSPAHHKVYMCSISHLSQVHFQKLINFTILLYDRYSPRSGVNTKWQHSFRSSWKAFNVTAAILSRISLSNRLSTCKLVLNITKFRLYN